MKELDNIKMCESILGFKLPEKESKELMQCDPLQAALYVMGQAFKKGLRDQGMEYVAGRIQKISQRMVSAEAKEALLEPKFKIGDKIVEDNEFGMVRGEITDIDHTHYELNGDRYIPISQQNYFKLIESEPESKSTVQKQDPCNDSQELTEFEKALAECINRSQCSIITPELLAVQCSDELLAIARKQIIEEASEWLEGNLYNEVCYGEIRPDIVAAFIEDFKNTLK